MHTSHFLVQSVVSRHSCVCSIFRLLYFDTVFNSTWVSFFIRIAFYSNIITLDITIFIFMILWQIELNLWDISHIYTLSYPLHVLVLKRKKALFTLVLRVSIGNPFPFIEIQLGPTCLGASHFHCKCYPDLPLFDTSSPKIPVFSPLLWFRYDAWAILSWSPQWPNSDASGCWTIQSRYV